MDGRRREERARGILTERIETCYGSGIHWVFMKMSNSTWP